MQFATMGDSTIEGSPVNIYRYLVPPLLTWTTRTSLASRCHHLPNPLASTGVSRIKSHWTAYRDIR